MFFFTIYEENIDNNNKKNTWLTVMNIYDNYIIYG